MRIALIAAIVIHVALITGCALHKSVHVKDVMTFRFDPSDPRDKPYYDAAEWMHEHIGDYVDDTAFAQYEQLEIKTVQDDLEHEMILRPGDHEMWRQSVRKAMNDFHALSQFDLDLHSRSVL